MENNKILTKKQFEVEISPFIKAYRKINEFNSVGVLEDAEDKDGVIWYCNFYKLEDKKFELSITKYENDDDQDGTLSEFTLDLEKSPDLILTDIVEYFSYKYYETVLKNNK